MRQDFKQLLQDCKNFERNAQRQMVDLLAPFLSGVCKRYEGAHASAQDLVQESLILIFNHIEDCRHPEEKPFMGWCKRIAINVSLDKIRKKNLPIESMEQPGFNQNLPPEIFARLGAEDILQTLNLLPENQRLVFNLFVLDGYSHAEIGQMLDIKESSARTLLVRARVALQEIISKQEILSNEY